MQCKKYIQLNALFVSFEEVVTQASKYLTMDDVFVFWGEAKMPWPDAELPLFKSRLSY